MVAARRGSRPALMALDPARPSWSGVSAEGVVVHMEERTRCCCYLSPCAARAARRWRCERAVLVRRRGRRVGQASTGRRWRCSGRRTARRVARPRGTGDALGPVRVRYVDGTSRRRAGGAARSVRRVCAWAGRAQAAAGERVGSRHTCAVRGVGRGRARAWSEGGERPVAGSELLCSVRCAAGRKGRREREGKRKEKGKKKRGREKEREGGREKKRDRPADLAAATAAGRACAPVGRDAAVGGTRRAEKKETRPRLIRMSEPVFREIRRSGEKSLSSTMKIILARDLILVNFFGMSQ